MVKKWSEGFKDNGLISTKSREKAGKLQQY
jgi:hypothetical protein